MKEKAIKMCGQPQVEGDRPNEPGRKGLLRLIATIAKNDKQLLEGIQGKRPLW